MLYPNQNRTLTYQTIFVLMAFFCYQDIAAQIYTIDKKDKEQFAQNNRLEEWIPYRKGTDWYFIDTQGNKVLDAPDFEIVYPFNNGLAMIAKEECYGFINEMGEVVIPCQLKQEHEVLYYRRNSDYLRIRKVNYVESKRNFNNIATKKPVWTWMGYDRTHKTLTDYYAFDEMVIYSSSNHISYLESDGTKTHSPEASIRVKQGNYWGVLDGDMQEIIPCNYEELHILDNETFIVKKEDSYLQIDANETILQNYDADNIKAHAKGYRIKRGNYYGFINKSGDISIPVEMDGINHNPNSISFRKNSQLGWATLEGKMLTPVGFNQSYRNQSKELIFVSNEDNIYRISQKGKNPAPILTNYSSIKKSLNNHWLITQNNKKGIYKDKEIITPKYDNIQVHNLDRNNTPFFFVKQENKWGILDNNAQEIIPIQADSLQPIFNINTYTQETEFKYINQRTKVQLSFDKMPIVFIKKDSKWGLLNKDGNDNGTIQYDQIQSLFHYKLFSVQKEGKWGVIDDKGDIIIPIKESFAPFLKGEETTDGFFLKIGLKEGLTCFFLKKNFIEKPIKNTTQKESKFLKKKKQYNLILSSKIPNNTPCTCSAKIPQQQLSGAQGPQVAIEDAGAKEPQVYKFRHKLIAATALSAADSLQLTSLTHLLESATYGTATGKNQKERFENKYIPTQFEEIRGIRKQYLFAQVNNKWGFFDHHSDYFIIQPTYENVLIDYRHKKVRLVKKDEKWWILNECGEIESPYTPYKEVKETAKTKPDSYSITKNENNKQELQNKIGEAFANSTSDTIVPWSSHSFLLKKSNQWMFFDKKNQEMKAFPFDDFIILDNQKIIGKKNDQWNLLNANLETLNKTAYDTIYKVPKNYYNFFIKEGNKIGLISREGVETLPPIYEDLTIEDNQIICKKGMIFIRNDHTVSVYDSIIKTPFFRFASPLMLVQKNDKFGFIDKDKVYFENE